LAIVLNGVIRATYTLSGIRQGNRSFSAILPGKAFEAGKNEVDVLMVGRSEDSLNLSQPLDAKTR
jgi:hypothetical protein